MHKLAQPPNGKCTIGDVAVVSDGRVFSCVFENHWMAVVEGAGDRFLSKPSTIDQQALELALPIACVAFFVLGYFTRAWREHGID